MGTSDLAQTVWTAATERFTKVGGLIAGCGQAALLTILHVSKGLPVSGDELKALIVQGINTGHAGAGGTSTPADLEWLAAQHGQPLTDIQFAELDKYVGKQPVILGVNKAYMLGPDDAGVKGHYITVLAKSGRNYVVADPNSVASETGGFVLYSPTQLQAADPFWTAVAPVNTGSTSMLSAHPPGAGIWGSVAPAAGSAAQTAAQVIDLNSFFAQLGNMAAWLGNPGRILKLIAGGGLILMAIILAFFKEGVKYAPDILKVAAL